MIEQVDAMNHLTAFHVLVYDIINSYILCKSLRSSGPDTDAWVKQGYSTLRNQRRYEIDI